MTLEKRLERQCGESIQCNSSIDITLSRAQPLVIICPFDEEGHPIINKNSVGYIYLKENNDHQSKIIFAGNYKIARYKALVKFAQTDEDVFGLSLVERTQLKEMADEMHFNLNRA
ncbi:MAG: hypothetical protein AABX16_01675 [Nanoarchaeota archaeon]